MDWALIPTWLKDAGWFIGPVGGLAGLYTFFAGLWRRRLRVCIDYAVNSDAHHTWHEFIITNRSDLPMSFSYVGPAWFMRTAFLPVRLSFARDMEDPNSSLYTLGPRASETFIVDDEGWFLALPKERRGVAFLKVGLMIPLTGELKWVPLRKPQKWDLSVRERLINHVYKLQRF